MVELQDLGDWAANLQVGYGRWVRLPACWPCHRGLREELAAFWYWRQRLDQAPDAGAEEVVRWHQSLRVSAQAWAAAYGGCLHTSLGEIDEQRVEYDTVREAADEYLRQLARDWSGRGAEPR